MKKRSNIEITELFLVKTDVNKTFLGEITREEIDGKIINHGTVVINEGKIWSNANTIDELGDNLDDIATLKLNYNLHNNPGIFKIIAFDLINNAENVDYNECDYENFYALGKLYLN